MAPAKHLSQIGSQNSHRFVNGSRSINPKALTAPSAPIPTGLRLKAQGCEARATLGKRTDELSTPTGLRPIDADRPASEAHVAQTSSLLYLGVPIRRRSELSK